jgi:hypothetical protein
MNELLNSLTAGDSTDQPRVVWMRFAYGMWTVAYTYEASASGDNSSKIEVTVRGDEGEDPLSVVKKLHDRVSQIAQRGMPELRPFLTYEPSRRSEQEEEPRDKWERGVPGHPDNEMGM